MAGQVVEEAVCPECGHAVREHQPIKTSRHSAEHVACMACDCIITMLAKLRAWKGGRRK